MARRSRMSQMKRQRELDKAEKAARKRAKRHEQAKESLPEADAAVTGGDSEDPAVNGEPVQQKGCPTDPAAAQSSSLPPEESNVEEVTKPVDGVIAYCRVCKTRIDHEIIEKKGKRPKQVKCRTCRDAHPYRAKCPAPKREAAGIGITYEILVKRSATSPAKKYEMSALFADSDQIAHEKFGVGFVTRILTDSKIEVLFADGTRTLAHNR